MLNKQPCLVADRMCPCHISDSAAQSADNDADNARDARKGFCLAFLLLGASCCSRLSRHRRCSARSGHDTSHSDVDGGVVRGLHVHEGVTGGGVEW